MKQNEIWGVPWKGTPKNAVRTGYTVAKNFFSELLEKDSIRCQLPSLAPTQYEQHIVPACADAQSKIRFHNVNQNQ